MRGATPSAAISIACIVTLVVPIFSAESEADTKASRPGFSRIVANLDYAVLSLQQERPVGVARAPEASSPLWYGTIMRRLPGDGPRQAGHYIPFAVDYVLGAPSRAWCDINLNGDLTDDPAVGFSAYPQPPGAISFLADFRWTARLGPREFAVEWKVRVVLEPPAGPEAAPLYREQRVFAMAGTLTLEGKSHRALLFDGNGDGLYTKDFADGVFVDLDDDLHFEIDQMSPAFGPFATPFQMAGQTYEVVSIDPEGRELTLVEKGRADSAAGPPSIGGEAPDFSYRDAEGHEVRLSDYRGRFVLVYFWASWCGVCSYQAPELKALYERYRPSGLEILGISYDTDRSEMRDFRVKHGHSWPTSFSGRMLWEDPVGRLYQVRSPGIAFLIDRGGRLEGTYQEMAELSSRLSSLFAQRPQVDDNR